MTHNWRNIELADRDEKDNLCNFLRSLDIYFEVSGCFDCWHIEIKLTEEEEKAVNAYIDNGFLPPVYEVLGYYGKNFSGLAESCFTWSEEIALDKSWEYAARGLYIIVRSPDGEERYTPEEIRKVCEVL